MPMTTAVGLLARRSPDRPETGLGWPMIGSSGSRGCQDGPRQAQDSGNLGHLGAILGHPGVILSRLGAILGSLGPSWGHLEAVLGHLGSVLALSWAIPERPRASQSVPVSGSFFGTPFAPKTLLFARKNQHSEGAKMA